MASQELVYKYVAPERLDILEKGLIRFTQPAALNDPFESTPNLQDVRRYLKNLAGSTYEPNRSDPDDVEELVRRQCGTGIRTQTY